MNGETYTGLAVSFVAEYAAAACCCESTRSYSLVSTRHRHLCCADPFDCTWILDVCVVDPAIHLASLFQHVLRRGSRVGEYFYGNARRSNEWGNALNDALVFLALLVEVNRRPDARYFTMCGFEAIRDGFVVWPSRYPSKPLIRTVSSGSPLSSRIRVLERLIIL